MKRQCQWSVANDLCGIRKDARGKKQWISIAEFAITRAIKIATGALSQDWLSRALFACLISLFSCLMVSDRWRVRKDGREGEEVGVGESTSPKKFCLSKKTKYVTIRLLYEGVAEPF